MNVNKILSKVHKFKECPYYINFVNTYNSTFNTKADCIGINLDANQELISIKKYLSLDLKNLTFNNKIMPKIPFFKNAVRFCLDSETSPCVGLKEYDGIYTKYFHIKYQKEVYKNNRNFFKTNNSIFDPQQAQSYGISIENKKIIKYYYFKPNLKYLARLKNINYLKDLNSLNKIEFVKYKNKSKIIISSSINFLESKLYLPFKNEFNIFLKGVGYDSEGNSSYYFFK